VRNAFFHDRPLTPRGGQFGFPGRVVPAACVQGRGLSGVAGLTLLGRFPAGVRSLGITVGITEMSINK